MEASNILNRLFTNPIDVIKFARSRNPSFHSTCNIAKTFFKTLGGLGFLGAYGCGFLGIPLSAALIATSGGASFIPLVLGTIASIGLYFFSFKIVEIMNDSNPRGQQVELFHGRHYDVV